MVTRADVVTEALKWNGNGDGEGYPGYQNPFSQDLGRPNEFWCGDFVTDIYKRVGLALPPMQPGCKTGFAYCPDALNWGNAHKAVVGSWNAMPGDIILVNTHSGSQPGHTELVTAYTGSVLYTIGGDSGPSNIDHYKGQGGVHRHMWSAPNKVGNANIMAVLNAGKAVTFGADPKKHKTPPVPSENPRLLMLKSPMQHGGDVKAVQEKLKVKADGIYGPVTRDAVLAFQKKHKLHVDGIVGPQTRKALGL